MSYINWPVSQIATEIPGATAIFFENKINFCCDGNKTLADVVERKQLDPQPILSALEQLNNRKENGTDLSNASNQEVIDHLLVRYHGVHKAQLPELHRLAARVELVHKDHPLCPTGLAQHLSNIFADLQQHMHKEEAILFPLLASGQEQMAVMPIQVMESEHDSHLHEIEKIYALTNDVTLHPGACNTWQALYLGLQDFITDLNMHIHIENTVLFARAKQHATGVAQ
ncbi:iron-sulfur cluster repair protein YtfE [Teredinibacter turnerae]|uniref:iron-sulfur cluster repair protein YtfE n=1 Tax=Teredinibacter turnerae TaxID=2426 RepID=UPI00037E9B26|nr:iron-sulfur cluster repair protein YtfE [Teredinibacter turnerae]